MDGCLPCTRSHGANPLRCYLSLVIVVLPIPETYRVQINIYKKLDTYGYYIQSYLYRKVLAFWICRWFFRYTYPRNNRKLAEFLSECGFHLITHQLQILVEYTLKRTTFLFLWLCLHHFRTVSSIPFFALGGRLID